MRTNLVQTCKTSANRINLNRTAMRVALIGLFISLGIGNAWGSKTYYSTMNVAVTSGQTGYGTVYVNAAGTTTQTKNSSSTSSPVSHSYNIYATANAGYRFSSWSGSGITFGSTTTANTTGSISTSSTSSPGTSKTATASFVVVGVTDVDYTSIDLAPTNASADYPFTVTFTTTNKKDLNDFTKTPATADGKFTITSWTQDGDSVIATGKFNGGGTYGGASRNNSTTVTLASLGAGGGSKNCTVTANFPALEFVSAKATEVFATQGESGRTGSATFKFNYAAEDDFPTTPTLVPTSGTGTFTVTGYTVTPDFSKGETTVTVDYSFDTNNGVGETPATLTLTAVNGDVHTVTVTGHSEALATNDASVTPAGGSPTQYATFAQALAAANGLTGSTLTLLRNVDLGTITATNNITKAMTIDLNGKTLQATVTSAIPLLTINATTTITDSKSGGVIYNTGAINGVVYGVTVASGKTLTVSGGTIKAENTQQYFYGTASVGGTETNKTSVGARGIQQTATATVNIEGGTIQGLASRNAFGIREEGSKANNTTLNITGGTIYAEAASYAYGVYGLGKVNISDDAIITVQINTNTVNGNETYTNYRINTSKALDSYTLNGYGYGVHVTASPTNKAADCYFGTLNMTGGTINAYNANVNMVGTAVQNQYMYGVYIGAGAAIKKTNTAPDGTLTQKASAIGQITGGTINVENDGQLAYGVIVYGSYNSFDNSESIFGISNTTVNVSAYSSAYGILSNASVGTSSSNYGGCYAGKIMLTNNNVTTTTTTGSTSVALYATGTMTTIKTATSATYAGEYEASGYMYVKSGTYTANSATSYATAAIAGPWTTSNAQRGAFKTYFAVDGSLGGNVESMSGIYISGGKFIANATTSHARGVWNSGTTIIAGGTFEANATTTNAYGIYSNRGVVQANGATLKAVAGTGTAYGVFSDAMINDYVGWKYAADYTLTNCNITASTTTGNTAYGVYINGTTRTISSVNSSYASIGDVVLGGYAIVGNASVKGCTINATSAGTTAGGIYRVNTQVSADKLDICQGELTATGNTIIARTNGGATAYGIRSGGPSTISNNTITVTTSSTGSNGIVVGDGNATISGNTVSASGTGTVYGIQTYSAVNSTTGYLFQSNATLEDNTVTATTTSGNTAYAVYVTTADGVNIASGTFAGDYVAAGSLVINSGKYTATAAGTTGYALVLDATKTKNAASGSATCTVNGGKFKGTASSTYADVNASAAVGDLVLAGGYYVNETNLTNYVADGYAVTALTSGEVYNEGYRRQISDNSGAVVCKVYQGSTLKKSCQSVEEALQYTQQNSSTTLVIVVVENCVLSAGDHILPSNATLFVPYKDGQTSIDTHATRYYGYTTPSPYKKLTFAAGAHLDAWGKIQAGGRQAATGQMDGKNGCPHEKYGWIYLHEGSSITLESGSYLYAWGYVTGPGEIDAKRGSTVYESFQIRDWRGGTATSGWKSSNKGTNGAFPVTQYYIQNIESPIKFRPGAVEKCDGTVNAASNYRAFNDVKFIGTTNSGSFFEMEDEDMSEDTWVRKWYDAVNDKQVYEVNSSAKMNSITLSLYGYSFSSSDFVLPVTNNMKIHLLTGSLQITQNTELLPGAEIEVDKEATAYINSGKSLYVFDIDDWMNLNGTANVHTYPLPYSPSWKVPTTCPRGKKVTTDASLNIHGKFQVNGSLYTTAGGANIYSSNEDAGTITYGTAAPSSGTVYVNVTTTASSKTAKTANPAWLKNEDTDEPWSYTSGTASGKSWMYYNDKWNCWSENNCFGYDAQNKPYAKPRAWVQLTGDVADANHLYHDAETGNRAFIVEDGCMWWEVEPTPYDGNKYKCVDPDYDGRYKYYEYVNNKWQEAVVTITWMNGSTTLATYSNALYGVRPKYLNGNPTKSATSTEYYTWKGWNKGSADGEFFAKDADLPIANENTTYYACFETHKYQYTITFKNSAADGGMVIDAPLVDAGERPVCRVTPTKTATAAETFEFSNWSGYAPGAELPVVTGSAEYTAVYTGTPRPYTITFQNFDGTVLQQSDVNYGTTPTYDGATPYRAKDAFYSYTFSEWSPAITSVTGEATYTAQYTSTTRGFTIQFVDYDGTVLEVKDVPRGQTPEYTGSSISRAATVDKTYTFNSWSPALVEVTEDAIYTATYNETPREYTITWIDGNGATLKTDQVAYGETPEYSGATPQKASTDDHSYVFNNTWLPAIVAVTGEATYTAQFNETERQYRVTWDAATNGGTCATEYTDFSYNAAIGTLPVASKEGHTFNGWFTSASGGTQITAATKVTADVTYHAQFTINTHSLAWNANGGTLSGSYTSGTVTYGITIAVPTVTRDGYIFDGWHDGTSIVDPASSMPDNDLTYTAQWTPAVASVIVNSATTYYATIDDAFTAANNATAASTLTLLQDVTVTTKLTYNNSNNKDCILDLNGHTLTSNTSEQSPLHINNTSVTFTITDGTVEKAGKLSLNSSFSTRAIFGVYVQLGTLLLNAGTIEVTSSTANTCGVTADQNGIFTMNGGIIHVKTTNGKEGRGVYLAGSVSINGGTVHVEAAGDGYGIKRDGGTVTINNGKFNISASGSTYVTNQASTNSKVVIRGGYYTTNNQLNPTAPYHVFGLDNQSPYLYEVAEGYTLTWTTDGDPLAGTYTSGVTKPGTTIVEPATPTKTGYTFSAWSPAVAETMPVEDTEYTATWTPNTNTAYAVKHYQQNLADDEYTLFETDNLTGTTDAATEAIAKSYTGFTAQSFSQSTIAPDGSTTVSIYYNRDKFTITWNNADGSTLETDANVKYGAFPAYDGTTPTKTTDAEYAYAFNGWSPAVSAVTADATYTATYTTTPVVASLTVNSSGNKYYYTDFSEAFNIAKNSVPVTITLLRDASCSEALVYNGSNTDCTLDLNGHTLTGTPSAQLILNINKAGSTFTITDGSANHDGKLSFSSESESTSHCVIVNNGTFVLEEGTIEATSSTASIGAVKVAGGTFTMNENGAVHAKYTGNVSGKNSRLVNATGGTTNINGGTIHLESTSDAIGVVYSSGTVTITGGNFKIEAGGTAAVTNQTGANNSLNIRGGYYSANSTGYFQPHVKIPYHIFSNSDETYIYRVAEAYTITFVDGDGNTLLNPATTNNLWKKGETPAYTGSTPTKSTDAQYTYTFTGWSPVITTVTEAATYTAQFSSTPRTYTVTLNTNDGTINAGDVTEYTYGTGATLPTDVTKDGYEFGGWFDNDGLTGDAVTTISTTATGNKEYWAKWVASIADRELDIVDWTSNSITINVTNLKAESGTNKNNWTIRVNGTDYTRTSPECSTQSRTLTVTDLSLTPNENLLIQLKNDADVIESQHNYKIPQIYNAENATLSDTNEESVVYVYGGKLTISGNPTLAALYVCPGAEVEVNGSLTVGKLVLRTKPWATAAISGNVTATNVYYTRIAPDGSSEYPTGQYYQFGLPYECAISAVRLSDGTTPAYNTTWILKNYDEESRATNGATGENWDVLSSGTIAAGRGYEMFSSYKYYREYYFPVTPTENTSVAVTRHGEDKNNSGWNIVCSPLMSIYHNESDPVTGLKVSWLLTDGSYDQEWPETIWPALPFSYQASATGSLDFSSGDFNQTVSAPRRAAYKEDIQTEWIHLDVKDENGVGDHTSVFVHPDRFESTYQTGIDVAKQSLTASRALIYSSHAYGEMAFAGVADALLEQGVALTVYSPKEQELTISMRKNDWLNRMAYVWLIDQATGAQIDLLESDYSFNAEAGTTAGRFILMGAFFAPQITTDNGNVQSDEDIKATKFIYNDKMYIQINGVIYDATGKLVK